MRYVLKSKKTELYYSFKRYSFTTQIWCDNISQATSYASYNPMRFIMKWYMSIRYEPVRFVRLLYMKVVMKNKAVIK
jgi:hypothetical protein